MAFTNVDAHGWSKTAKICATIARSQGAKVQENDYVPYTVPELELTQEESNIIETRKLQARFARLKTK